MILNLILSLLVSVSYAEAPKKKTRKPNQVQEYYFACTFFKQGSQPMFELTMKTPSKEKEIVYEESNRSQTLMVKVMRAGYVQFFLYNERPKKLLASGSLSTQFHENFEIEAPGAETNYLLSCKN